MTLEFYRTLHLAGLIVLFLGFGLMLGNNSGRLPSIKRLSMALHGGGLLALLVSGFGMLAKLGLMANFPTWALLKVLIWIALGGATILLKRLADRPGLVVALVAVLGILAAALAVGKFV